MPSDRVEIIARGFESFNDGDFGALLELLHEDVVSVVPDNLANSGVYRGHEGFANMLQHWTEPWEELHYRLCETLEEAREHGGDI